LRCDANISVRPRGQKEFGAKAEVKNLNSFRFAKMALDYEIARQVKLIERGGKVEQETRLYNSATGETAGMRSKEHAHDYRYFPEPDLLPLRVSDEWLSAIRETMPELPAERRQRFIESYGLREYDAQVLTSSRELGDYFERVASVSGDAKSSANWVITDLLGLLAGRDVAESPVSAERLGELVSLVAKGELSGKMAREIFPKMAETGDSAPAIMEREGLKQISDSGALSKIVDDVIAANPKQVAEYRAGKAVVLKFLVGQVMKLSRGQANPAAVNELFGEKLK
jgi:aspartyl-tRNA(Asn)/glutamyl-tRNA(Gln) amidotransferase subunit B